jgi:hypothetical protein
MLWALGAEPPIGGRRAQSPSQNWWRAPFAVRRAASSRNIFGVDIGVGYAVEVSANYGVSVNKIGFAVKIDNIECPFRGVGVEINGSQPRGDPFNFHFNRGESSIKGFFILKFYY